MLTAGQIERIIAWLLPLDPRQRSVQTTIGTGIDEAVTLDLYLGLARFESLPGHWPPWKSVLWLSSIPINKWWDITLSRPWLIPSNSFPTHYSSIIPSFVRHGLHSNTTVRRLSLKQTTEQRVSKTVICFLPEIGDHPRGLHALNHPPQNFQILFI